MLSWPRPRLVTWGVAAREDVGGGVLVAQLVVVGGLAHDPVRKVQAV